MEKTHHESKSIEPGQEWEIDLFRPEDAPGVTDLFRSVYGTGYPIKTYIDPALLIEENASGRTISSVAKTQKGDIVGHIAFYQSAPFKGVYESGAGAVHKDYRGGKGIFTDLVVRGQEEVAKRVDIHGIFGEAVCNHVFSQKMTMNRGWVTHAVEVDLMPSAAYTKEKSAPGRVASLLDFKTLKPKPHRVWIPEVYDEPLRYIYEGLDDSREIRLSDEAAEPQSITRMESQVFDFAQVARLAVWEAGSDFETTIEKEEGAVRDQGVTVIQVWLNLSQPCTGRVTGLLRNRGFFLGGILPRWFDTDGLLMMKILHRPHWEDMNIFSERAKRIVDIARSDWEKRQP
ncbi:MAG: hypothetical protein ABII06_16415 [Pseudomonadota bacterium]